MAKISAFVAGSANRRFVLTRAVSTALALALALFYTKVLGIDKRSVLAFVMTSSLIFTILLTSGISLTYRKNIQKKANEKELDSYLVLIFLLSILVALLSTALLVVYAHIQTPIQLPLYAVAFVYSFLACLNFGFQDGLLAVGKLKRATILDLATIVIQIVALLLLLAVKQTSLIVSVFLAFIISYVTISLATLLTLSKAIDFRLETLASSNGTAHPCEPKKLSLRHSQWIS